MGSKKTTSNHLGTRYSLLIKIKDRKDQDSWKEFINIYRPFLISFLRKHNIPANDCEDICQDVFIKLYNYIEKYQREENIKFRTWLGTVVKNTMISHLKKIKIKRTHDQYWLKENSIELKDDEMTQKYEEQWQQHVCQLAMNRVKDKFSGKAMQVFEMCLHGHQINYISRQLNLKKDSVYKLRSRVKRSLKIEVENLKKELE